MRNVGIRIGSLLSRVRETPERLVGGARRPRDQMVPDTTEGTLRSLRRAARAALVPRWLAASRTRFFSTMAAVGVMAFAALTMLVSAGLTAEPDLATSLAVQQVQHPLVAGLMTAVSALGFAPLNLIVVAGVSGLIWLAGYRVESVFALLAGSSGMVSQGIKALMERPRPEVGVVRVVESVQGHSFPSGHTFFYVTFFGFLAYASFALLKRGWLRTALLWLCGGLIVLVGPSRIWLCHHSVSDVLASDALGLAYLILLIRLYHRMRLRPS